jgi:uncharacterized Ntn-hydrolase superfamily protein
VSSIQIIHLKKCIEMKKLLLILLVSFTPILLFSQHTFSIVAVDTVTGEIGSAGATCGDSIIWPGTPGAKIISQIFPGKGGIHTQASYIKANANNAATRMKAGDSPQEIIDWLKTNDIGSNPKVRQYGIVDYNSMGARSAAFTGEDCFDYKNHIVGPNYAIQGNIILGQYILDSMEARFNNTQGCLSDKLMAAMQGANVVGADSRCTSEGTSSLSAFLRVAKPTDHPDTLFLDINVAGTGTGVEPIDVLQTRYNNWKLTHTHDCSPVTNLNKIAGVNEQIIVYPNPSNGAAIIQFNSVEVRKIEVLDALGRVIREMNVSDQSNDIQIENLSSGIYFLHFFNEIRVINTVKMSVY